MTQSEIYVAGTARLDQRLRVVTAELAVLHRQPVTARKEALETEQEWIECELELRREEADEAWYVGGVEDTPALDRPWWETR